MTFSHFCMIQSKTLGTTGCDHLRFYRVGGKAQRAETEGVHTGAAEDLCRAAVAECGPRGGKGWRQRQKRRREYAYTSREGGGKAAAEPTSSPPRAREEASSTDGCVDQARNNMYVNLSHAWLQMGVLSRHSWRGVWAWQILLTSAAMGSLITSMRP